MSVTIKGIKAGSTTITASYTEGNVTVTSTGITLNVSRIDPVLSFSPSPSTLIYDGTAKTLGTINYNHNDQTGLGQAYYYVSTSSTAPAANASGWITCSDGSTVVKLPGASNPNIVNAGTYHVYLKATQGTCYNAVSVKDGGTKEIGKRTVSITAPSYNTNTLKYTGNSQTIASGGNCGTGGTFYYYISTTNSAPTVTAGSAPSGTGWSTTAPTATNVGTYYVWYYVYVSDTSNNKGTDINTVKALTGSKQIELRTGMAPSFSANPVSATCRQDQASVSTGAFTGATAGHGGTITTYEFRSAVKDGTSTSLSGWSLTSSTRVISIPANTPSGTYKVTVRANEGSTTTDTSSYTDAIITVNLGKGTQDFTLTGSPSSFTSTYNNGGTITVSGNAGTISSVSSGTTAVATASYSGSVVTVTCVKAGKSVISITCSGNDYVNARTKTQEWTINKATQSAPTISTTNATKTYNATASVSASGGGGHGSIEWSNVSTLSTVGTKTTKARWSGDDNYEPSPWTSEVTLTVSKYTPTVTLSATNRIYNGSPLYATATVSLPSGGKAPKGTIYYGTTSGSQTYSVAYDGEHPSSLSSVSVTNYNNGSGNTKTVYAYFVPDATCNDVYNNSGNANRELQITGKAESKRPDQLSGGAWQGDSKVYHNGPAVLTYSGTTSDWGGTIKFRYDHNNGTSWTETTTAPTRTDENGVGSTAVQCMIVGDGNHNNSTWSSPSVTLTLTSTADAKMTVNTVSGLTYSGNAQVIANGVLGTNPDGNHGVASYQMGYYYAAPGDTTVYNEISDANMTYWSSAFTNNNSISATNAGKYYIYYKFTSDSNHSNNKSCTYVGVTTIGQAISTISWSPTTTYSVQYGTTSVGTPVGATGTNTGTISYSITTADPNNKLSFNTSNRNLTLQASTNAGSYSVTVTASASAANSNYSAPASVSKTFTVTVTATAGQVTYNTITDTIIVYCTTEANTAIQMTNYNNCNVVTISTGGITGATGTTHATITPSGWSVASDGKTLTIPTGTLVSDNANTLYRDITATITVDVDASANGNYAATTVSRTVTIRLYKQILTNIAFSLASNSISYNSTTTVVNTLVTYSNGTTKSVTDSASYSASDNTIVQITKS